MSLTCVVRSFHSLISGVVRPRSVNSVSVNEVSCDHVLTSLSASRRLTSPDAREMSALSSSACSTILGATRTKWPSVSLERSTFSTPSRRNMSDQWTASKPSPRTSLRLGATSRSLRSTSRRCSATGPAGQALAFSTHAATKSSNSHSRPRKEIQSSTESLASSSENSWMSPSEPVKDSRSARTSSRFSKCGGGCSKCSHSSATCAHTRSTASNSALRSVSRAPTSRIASASPIGIDLGLSSNQRAAKLATAFSPSATRSEMPALRSAISAATIPSNASTDTSSSSHSARSGPRSGAALLEPPAFESSFDFSLSSRSVSSAPRMRSLSSARACRASKICS
mmetsp:Transcript_19752/g.46580  ORF Transcript_19752/g.46580 Transcript_19752/m.46580 type:complete len:340 (+) Transcript_19752:1295-2314(+)